MLAAFGNHGHGPLIVFGDRSSQFRMAVGVEPYLFAYAKIEHHGVRPHLSQEAQSRDDLMIQLD
jgi:hypothetical protein